MSGHYAKNRTYSARPSIPRPNMLAVHWQSHFLGTILLIWFSSFRMHSQPDFHAWLYIFKNKMAPITIAARVADAAAMMIRMVTSG